MATTRLIPHVLNWLYNYVNVEMQLPIHSSKYGFLYSVFFVTSYSVCLVSYNTQRNSVSVASILNLLALPHAIWSHMSWYCKIVHQPHVSIQTKEPANENQPDLGVAATWDERGWRVTARHPVFCAQGQEGLSGVQSIVVINRHTCSVFSKLALQNCGEEI